MELAANPVPLTVTGVPAGPLAGTRDIEGVTLNLLSSEFPEASLDVIV